MYELFIGSMQAPVAPETITTQINGKNETLHLINDGEMNVLKLPGLTTASFTLLLPSVQYPFARYPGGFQAPQTFLDYFQSLKEKKEPFQWVVSRSYPGGRNLHSTNIKMVLEDYTIREDKKSAGFDLLVEIRLKEYKKEETKTFNVDVPSPTAPIVVQEQRPPSTTTKTKTGGTQTKKKTTVQDVAEHAKELAKSIGTKTGGTVGEAVGTLTIAQKIASVAKKAIDSTKREPTPVVKPAQKDQSKKLMQLR